MALIHQVNKKTGVVYVYDQKSRWIPELKQSRVVERKLVGKVDPDTGDIVPTGRRGRPKKASTLSDAQAKNGQIIAEEPRKAEAALKERLLEETKLRMSLEVQLKNAIEENKQLNSYIEQLLSHFNYISEVANTPPKRRSQ